MGYKQMKDIDVDELKTAEAIDAAFSATFGIDPPVTWAEDYNQEAITDFLEGMRGKRHIWQWSLTLRNWNRCHGNDFEAIVSSKNKHSGQWTGVRGYGYSDFLVHALMQAAIAWDQYRRERERAKWAAKRKDGVK